MKSITPNLKVENIEYSLKFYRDILGFEIVMANPEEDPVWVMLRCGTRGEFCRVEGLSAA